MKTIRYEQSDEEKIKSKRGRSARRKGHNFERDVANLAKEHWPGCLDVRRMLQGAGGSCLPDVEVLYDGKPLMHMECKKGKQPNIVKAMEQAISDHRPGVYPVAVTMRDRGEPMATMRLGDFMELVGPWLVHQIFENR